MMKIEAIHIRELNMPLAYPFETSFGVTTGRRILMIELEMRRHDARGVSVWRASTLIFQTRWSIRRGTFWRLSWLRGY